VRLEGLHEADVAAYLTARFPGSAVAARLASVLHRRTEGQPLFMVQTVDAWVQQGWVAAVAGQWTVQVAVDTVERGVAASVRQLIAQQYDGLSPAAQAVLEAASVVGAAFAVAAVAAGLERAVEPVEAQCEALVQRGQLVPGGGAEAWPDGTVSGRYGFVHALYQQVVYERLPVGRQMQLHRRIGLRQEVGYGAQAGARAAELALHFARGRDVPRALRYGQQAAENALRRYAYQEAIDHFTRGLEVLQTVPETPERVQRELAIQLALGPVFLALKGHASPEMQRTYERVQALCHQVGDTPQHFLALWGLYLVHLVAGQLQTTRALVADLLRLAQRLQEPGYLVEAHRAMGPTLFGMGELVAARTHLDQSLALYHPQQHREHAGHYGFDPKVIALNYLALTLWLLGYPDHAARHAQEALRWARELAHLPSLTHAMFLVTCFHGLARDVDQAYEQAGATISRASEHAFALYTALGTVMRGWAVAMQGQGETGLALLRQGLAAYRATGAVRGRSAYLGLLAEAYGEVGQSAAGLGTLAEALAGVHDTGDGYCEAELHRLKGTLWLRQPDLDERQAEACFHQALAIARRQEAKSLELRAAMSLSRLWQSQGKRTAAHALLAPIYGWFTEGFDTADLQDAKAMVEELGKAPGEAHHPA